MEEEPEKLLYPENREIISKIQGYTLSKEDVKTLEALCNEMWEESHSNANDGEAWKIQLYDEKENLIKSSGELGYIYGQKTLEAIVRLLPSPRNYFVTAYGK